MDMTGRMIAVAICIAALFGAGAARGQENLDHGKTPAQLFASDCAICHKSARGL
jgi:mono/diheme cytochrome c family protein